MRSETLHVTSKTTLSELQQFADKLDDRMRLRARKVEGGYELYAKDSKPSLWSRITGRSAQTRANARDAVFSVIDRAARTHGDVKVDMARTALYSGISSKDVKGQALKALLDTVPVGTSLESRGPGLNKLPESLRKDLINHAVGCITAEFRNGNTVPDSIADKIVRDWSTDIDRAHLTADKTVLTRLGL